MIFHEHCIYFLSHGFIHLDQRRPGAFEAFARNFLRRVNAEFAAAGDFAGGVVKHVGRAFGEDAVPLRIGVGAEAEEDFAGVRLAGGRVQCTRRPSKWVNPLFYFCSSRLVRRARVAQPVAKAEMNWFVP